VRELDIAGIKDALAAIKRDEAGFSRITQARRRSRSSDVRGETSVSRDRLADFFSAEDRSFRSGIASRLKARDLLATGTRPAEPVYARVEKPFLIWAYRLGGPASFLEDPHYEPLNSSATFYTRWSEDGIGPTDEIVFYFLWVNETGGDAVVNVESHLMPKGTAEVYCNERWIPVFGGGFGETKLTMEANLKVLEWWNQPPTSPLQQSGQTSDVLELVMQGKFPLTNWGAHLGGVSQVIAGTYYLHYDGFHVPADATAVFEVSLRMHYYCDTGWCEVNFRDPPESGVVCPYVEIEALTAPQMLMG
jgi:hypothetical protein